MIREPAPLMLAAPVCFMADLMRYAASLADLDARRPAPVDKWNPPYCGELDLVIRRDGVWVHEGRPITRARLVQLFSTVLKRENGRYFLVTPVEKLGIRVEDAPFLAVLMRVEDTADGSGGTRRRLVFTTNVGEEIVAGPGREIVMKDALDGAVPTPYLRVRADLWALIARPVYYDLAALGETRAIDGVSAFGVESDGAFFPLGRASADS